MRAGTARVTVPEISRKLAAIFAADVAGYSRLAGADEEGTVARLRALRQDLIDPIVGANHGRVVNTAGDSILVEFASVVDATRCGIDIQRAMASANTDVAADRRIAFRVGIHLGDVMVESNGDLMGDGVNIAARLEGLAEPGGICLSEDAWRQVRDKIAAEFADLGERELKNIARPVRVFRIALPQVPQESLPSNSAAPRSGLALPDRPSIAVLPFQNMSGDPDQEYFVDGMVEDIITGLSRINWLFVIARNSSFVYKGRAVDIKQVGHELGVRYVLEGSVRKAGSRVRITGQLIEAQTGTHVWAEKYDDSLADVFELQDRITASVVGIVEPSLKKAEIERARRKRPDSLAAYDLYLRALPHFTSAMPDDARLGMAFVAAALELDPNYAIAHAYMALGHENCFVRGGFDEADRVAGVGHARLALTHGSDDPTALSMAGFVMMMLGHDAAAASAAIARALALNASCAFALYHGALVHAYSGTPALAEEYANRALRLSPFDPQSNLAYLALGAVHFGKRRYDDAVLLLGKAVQANPRFSIGYARLAAALAMAGRTAEAKAAAHQTLELDPGFRIGRLTSALRFMPPELLEGYAEGCRRAGLPD